MAHCLPKPLRRAGVALAGILLIPALTAQEIQVAQLAWELTRSSNHFAAELGNRRGYGSVRFSANRLGREAGELAQAIGRNRGRSAVSAAFNDVTRQYQALEEAFFRASGSEPDSGLFDQVGLISRLFSSLQYRYQLTYHHRLPHRHVPAFGSRKHGLPHVPREAEPERRDRRDYGQISVRRPLEFSQGSPVLQRQFRRDARDDRLQRILQSRHGSSRDH